MQKSNLHRICAVVNKMAIFTFASDLVTFTLFANIKFAYGSSGGEFNSGFYICFGFAFFANCQFAVTRLGIVLDNKTASNG